jgi:hypothetical protein
MKRRPNLHRKPAWRWLKNLQLRRERQTRQLNDHLLWRNFHVVQFQEALAPLSAGFQIELRLFSRHVLFDNQSVDPLREHYGVPRLTTSGISNPRRQ